MHAGGGGGGLSLCRAGSVFGGVLFKGRFLLLGLIRVVAQKAPHICIGDKWDSLAAAPCRKLYVAYCL